MQNNLDNRFDAAEQKVSFLTTFLSPILNMLGDSKFFGTPLRIFYYVIAIANLFIPLGIIIFCGMLFVYSSYFPSWAWITVPLFCLILIILSLVLGVGSFAFWIRRLQDIMEYNRYNHTYMSLRNFALMQRTFGEWLGLVTMFFGLTDILTIFIPTEVLGGFGVSFLVGNILTTVLESVVIICVGYFIIFVAKFIYDWLETFANSATELRDLADIERLKMGAE